MVAARSVAAISSRNWRRRDDVVHTRLQVEQALVGVNYKFDWGGLLLPSTDFS